MTVARTSGNLRISAVPVFWSRSLGARSVGLGKGRLVRTGFRLRADDIAFSVDDGQMIVMSFFLEVSLQTPSLEAFLARGLAIYL